MIRIEITEQKISFETSGVNPQGRQYHIRKQSGFFHTPTSKYPRAISFGLHESQMAPYPVGMYELSDDSYRIDRYGNLALSQNLILIPSK